MDVLTHTTVARSQSPGILNEIRSADCNLSIWEREFSANFPQLLDANPRDVRFSTTNSQIAAQLSTELKGSGFQDSVERGLLERDIIELAEKFSSILNIQKFEVRIEVVTTNSCRKWHADYVTARLITTYAGTGTQWLCAKAAQQVRDGSDPDEIGQMSAGDVGIFKGKLATDEPAIHRSPPIEGTGERRLLLVLNPAEN